MTNDIPIDMNSGGACPLPLNDYPSVLLAHGGGGKLSQHLIQKMFVSQFNNERLEPMHDGAVFAVPRVDGSRMAFSTDSYVVSPLFFPGGDIGELSIYGTVNDLAMCGARPLYLSAAFIIEEGLPMDDLWRIVLSMKEAARITGVELVTGDTKVVEKGKADKLFINTAGVGIVGPTVNIDPKRAAPGDKILLSGPIGLHGIAIMSVREGLEFGTHIESDAAPLHELVASMLTVCSDIHVLRDPTRGGVASALNEIADSSRKGILINEQAILIPEEVQGACEILGFDPLYVANEGKVIAIVPSAAADRVLEAMRAHPLGREAAIIGEVVEEHPGVVVMKSRVGGSRVVDMLSGEQLPRIC